jgi:hypothetical protein
VRERQEEAKEEEEEEEEEQLGSYCRKRKKRMQIADCSQQDHKKICYKNFLHKTPGTKTQQDPKNSKQRDRERQRERESQTTKRETEREREERKGEEKK